MVKFKALVWLRAPNGPPLKMCILAQNLDPQSVSNPASLPLLERYQLSWLYACLSGLYISMHLICKIISLGLCVKWRNPLWNSLLDPHLENRLLSIWHVKWIYIRFLEELYSPLVEITVGASADGLMILGIKLSMVLFREHEGRLQKQTLVLRGTSNENEKCL